MGEFDNDLVFPSPVSPFAELPHLSKSSNRASMHLSVKPLGILGRHVLHPPYRLTISDRVS